MPESKQRPKHIHHHQPVVSHHTQKANRSAAFVVAVITALLGLAMAYFTKGADVVWLITGAASGAVIGYLIGRSMDKNLEKK